jgi:RHS repeat-associated protein
VEPRDYRRYYNVHRWLDTQTGRYTRSDPAGATELDPHLYTYVNSNTLRFIDPLGLRRWPFGAGRFCRDTLGFSPSESSAVWTELAWALPPGS